jgi:crotonobetainyl-CoA:carnitine CoA-transferase CaiB-like acyl-CoA transferase
MSEQKKSAGQLEGLRVLDMSTMLAGPYGATILGDMGADVIKIESHYGDESRHLGPKRGTERSPYLSLNRNKRDMVIDLQQEEAREVFTKVVKTADILICNIREPAMSKLGLNYEQVKIHKPDIIWIGVTAFGPDGPYAGRPGIDFLAQGYTGVLALNGEPDGNPVRTGFPAVDVMTSLLVSNAALAALRVRDQSGEGQRIEVSLLDTLMHAQASSLGSYLTAGFVTPRTGNRSLYFAPSGVYPTKDGKHVVITTPAEKFFGKLCRALDVEWDKEERFINIDARLANEDELDAVVAARTSEFSREELVEKLIAADVLTAPINQVEDVVKDPQILHNEMLVSVDHPTLGKVDLTGVPVKFYKTPGSIRLHPPLLGENTNELLAEVGYSKEEIAELQSKGLVADHEEILRIKAERRAKKAAQSQS